MNMIANNRNDDVFGYNLECLRFCSHFEGSSTAVGRQSPVLAIENVDVRQRILLMSQLLYLLIILIAEYKSPDWIPPID